MDIAQDLLFKFVEERVPRSEWKMLITPASVLERMNEEEEDEIKNQLWEDIKYSINWRSLLDEIRGLCEEDEDEDEEEQKWENEKEKEE